LVTLCLRARQVLQALALALGEADDQGCHGVILKQSAGALNASFRPAAQPRRAGAIMEDG